jgi:AcrR family transcriptional regulator
MEEDSPPRLTADDWLRAALDAFAQGGVDAVRIVPLAQTLGVTRGSFYWHFADRDALLLRLLQTWSQWQTDDIILQVERTGGAASERLLHLLETCARDEGRIDMALRAWAQSDETARKVVAEVDRKRIAYLAQLLSAAMSSDNGVATKARVAYAAWLGEYTGAAPASVETRLANMRCLHAMLLNA